MSDFNNLFAIALLLENKEIEQKFLSKVEGFESVTLAEMRDYLRSEIKISLETYQKKRPDAAISEILELLGNAAYVTVYVFKNWKKQHKRVLQGTQAEGEAIGSLIDAISGVIEPEEAESDIAERLLSLIQSGKIPHIKFEGLEFYQNS